MGTVMDMLTSVADTFADMEVPTLGTVVTVTVMVTATVTAMCIVVMQTVLQTPPIQKKTVEPSIMDTEDITIMVLIIPTQWFQQLIPMHQVPV